ncbi:hypothetical protein BGZ73_001190, partial [Actinomortierella ambigua]
MPPAQNSSNSRARQRYSFQTRRQVKVHVDPAAFHQFQHKDWKVPPDRPEVPSTSVTKKKALYKPLPPYKDDLSRGPVVKALDLEHPVVTLEVGSLHNNIVGVFQDKPDVARCVKDCLRTVVHQANEAKRQFQRILGLFLDQIFSGGIEQHDRAFLRLLCENINPQDASHTVNDDKQDDEIALATIKQSSFIQSIMVAIISGKDPARGAARDFFVRLKGLGLIDSKTPTTRYPASILARSISSQVCVQLKKHFKHGAVSLHEK